jgi:hypothetical protein
MRAASIPHLGQTTPTAALVRLGMNAPIPLDVLQVLSVSHAKRPGLGDGGGQRGPADQRHLLQEVNLFGHFRLRVGLIPKIVHFWAYGRQKPGNQGRPDLGLAPSSRLRPPKTMRAPDPKTAALGTGTPFPAA